MGFWQELFGPTKPAKEQARDRALVWWQQRTGNAAKCDVCNSQVARSQGYLLRTSEMLQSDSYIRLCSEKMGREFVRGAGIPGMDAIVMSAVMPAASVAMRDRVVAGIKKQTTPWLICETCLGSHFPKVMATV